MSRTRLTKRGSATTICPLLGYCLHRKEALINQLTIPYSNELLWALEQEPEEFEAEARRLLAVTLYQTGRLSTGLAATLAGVPRSTFFFLLGQYDLSPFGAEANALAEDLAHARQARRRQ